MLDIPPQNSLKSVRYLRSNSITESRLKMELVKEALISRHHDETDFVCDSRTIEKVEPRKVTRAEKKFKERKAKQRKLAKSNKGT